MVEDDSVFGACCSNHSIFLNVQVVLHLLSPILFYPCRCLSFCARRVVSRLRQVRPHVDPHLLLCPGCTRQIPCTSFCLGDAIFIHPCRTRQGSLDNRSHSLSTSIVVWFRRSSVRCQRCTTQTTSSVTVSLGVCRRHLECSWLNLWSSFSCNPWQWRFSSFFVRCNFHCQFHIKKPPFATECHTSRPSSQHRVHCSVSVSSTFCLTQLHSW